MIAYISAMALLTRMRGNGGGRVLFGLISFCLYYLYSGDIVPAAVVGLGLYLFWLLGTGRGFISVHGNYKLAMTGSMSIVDRVADKIFTVDSSSTISKCKKYGILWFSIRGLISILPLAIGWFLLGYNPTALIVAALSSGVIYFIGGVVKQTHAVMIAEIILGALLGASLIGGVIG